MPIKTLRLLIDTAKYGKHAVSLISSRQINTTSHFTSMANIHNLFVLTIAFSPHKKEATMKCIPSHDEANINYQYTQYEITAFKVQ